MIIEVKEYTEYNYGNNDKSAEHIGQQHQTAWNSE